jgi:hypothetical protein
MRARSSLASDETGAVGGGPPSVRAPAAPETASAETAPVDGLAAAALVTPAVGKRSGWVRMARSMVAAAPRKEVERLARVASDAGS